MVETEHLAKRCNDFAYEIVRLRDENKRQQEAIDYVKGKIGKWPQMLGYIQRMNEILSKP